jgi:hypothetical protein
MKTKFGSIRLACAVLSALLFVSVIACDDDDDNKNNNRSYTISGNANGSQVVPSVNGTGSGTITGTYNPNTRQLQYTSNWNGLTGAPTGGGFYSGASGSSGTAVGTPWGFGASPTGTGSTTGTMTLTESQAQQFLNGGWYYSYGTTANPNGEVRGQITATQQE